MHSELQEKGIENCLQTVTKDGFKIKNDEIKIIIRNCSPEKSTVKKLIIEYGIETAERIN